MYKGEADWTKIGEIKNNPRMHIPVFGNGDIDSPQKALEYKNRYGVDGVMIGRASIGNPWVFREIKAFLKDGSIIDPPTLEERVRAVKQHLSHSVEWKGLKLGVLEMRRHYTNYFRGFRGVKQFRSRLVTEHDPEIIFNILDEMQDYYSKEEILA